MRRPSRAPVSRIAALCRATLADAPAESAELEPRQRSDKHTLPLLGCPPQPCSYVFAAVEPGVRPRRCRADACQVRRLVAALAAATLVDAVPQLKIDQHFFTHDKTGKRFQIVGVAYQPGGSASFDPKSGKDPLSNADTCMRDAALMQVLGINTVRVYNLDPNINHDECASIFNAVSRHASVALTAVLVANPPDRPAFT